MNGGLFMRETLSAREIMKKHYIENPSQKIISYGKINKSLAYEVTKNNGPYLDHSKYHVTFAEIIDGEIVGRDDLDLYEKDYSEIEEYIQKLKLEF